MSSLVSIDLQARTGQATKELQSFSKQISGIAKVWENIMGGRGGQQAGANLQQLSKGVADLGKAADRSNMRLQAVNKSLEQVVARRKALEGSQGSVLLKDKDIYKSLTDQEKSLTRQQRTWAAIAANRNQIFANAQNGGGAGGGPGGGGAAGGSGPGGRFQNPLRQFASPINQIASSLAGGTTGSLIGGVLTGGLLTALGGAIGHIVAETIDAQKETADFIPRMRPGSLAGTNAFGLNKRMRGVGMPYGFNTRESTAIFSAMSEGGSNFGGGLERDSRTAMQFGRMFGIDAGGEASALATAQRTGAFKAGDAKKFAGMLAVEIARTGLGPRAQEVQEATLMLLNHQVQSLGSANPGPIMALQTAFNKTGIAGLQGMNGANTISRLQDAVTNPNSEAAEALNFSVFRKMGAKSLYDVKYLQEEGLNNPKTLQTLLSTVEQSAPSAHDADITLNQYAPSALSLHLLKAIRARNGGKLSGFTGNLKDLEKSLGTGAGFVEKGAAGAMELPGNQLRKIEAHLHDIMMKVGDTLVPKLITMADSADKGVRSLEKLLTSSDTIAHKTTVMADLAMRAAGIDPDSPGFKAAHAAAGVMGGIAEIAAAEAEKTRQFEKTHPGQKRRLGQMLNESLGGGLSPAEERQQHWDEFAPPGSYVPYAKRRHGPKGSPTNPTPALPAVKGMFETYDEAGGYQGAQAHGKHLTIVVREEGVVSDASKAALRRYIHDCVREQQQDHVRARPNSSNRRR